jgi:REP element-mobilizing transposase RayT
MTLLESYLRELRDIRRRTAGFQPAPTPGQQDAGRTERTAGFQPAQEQGRQDAGGTAQGQSRQDAGHAERTAGFQPAPELGRQDAGGTAQGQSRQDAGHAERTAGFQPAPEPGRQDAGGTTQRQSRQDAGGPLMPFRYDHVAIRDRGRLPHWEMDGATYSVTFRLGDSLPQALFSQLDFERKDMLKTAQQMGRDLSEAERTRLDEVYRQFDEALDAGYGACRLAQPEVAEMVYNALLHFEGERYELVAACVMPNHVHTIFAPLHGRGLADILQSWKSFTSKEANKLLGTTGQFWEREYFDRLIRNAAELERAVRYVVENPVKAGLKDWKWVWVRMGS